MCMLLFIIVIVCGLFEWKQNIKWEGWYPINWFNPAIFLCLSHARTWDFEWHMLLSYCIQFVLLILVALLAITV